MADDVILGVTLFGGNTEMTTKHARSWRRLPRRPVFLDDLDALEPGSSFRNEVEELRWFIAEHPRPIEEWTEADHEKFRRLAENDFMLFGLAMAAPGLKISATSDNPHRVFEHNAD